MDKLILGEKVKVKRKKGEDGYRTFSIRVREEIVEKLDTIAKETGRTRNELIGIFLKFAADNCIIEKKEEKP
ncbi:ribbon-helix-helix protein, CopG family [uncultured Oscillibacter sp.]|uniref:ribbon-helix-helix protein, CopG family n=1 Tax=uncultured Oscillibacter sp. TaxID=876091 RepID=UPI00261F0DAD|nr:ribbon-helix-helix protein, CopG family [uncultured Oscillibacter sp.]